MATQDAHPCRHGMGVGNSIVGLSQKEALLYVSFFLSSFLATVVSPIAFDTSLFEESHTLAVLYFFTFNVGCLHVVFHFSIGKRHSLLDFLNPDFPAECAQRQVSAFGSTLPS